MTHSHLPVQHLLKQVELYRERRAARDCRPEWVTSLIDEVADLFEPYAGVGRVGFDCQFLDDRWMVTLYLGKTEFVGGREDGQARCQDFQFNLLKLLDRFRYVERLSWDVLSDVETLGQDSPHSFLTIEGLLDAHPLVLRLFSLPPQEAGPGLRQFPNGSLEPV